MKNNQNSVSFVEMLKFIFTKKLIILLSVASFLFLGFVYNSFELGNRSSKAKIYIKIDSFGINTQLFVFNHALNNLIYGGNISSIVSAFAEKMVDSKAQIYQNEYIEKKDFTVNEGYLIRALGRFNFNQQFEGKINAIVESIDDDELTFAINSNSQNFLIKSKDEIEKQLYNHLNLELTTIYNDANSLNLIIKDMYLRQLEKFKNEKLKMLEKNYSKLVQHIDRQIDIAKDLQDKNVNAEIANQIDNSLSELQFFSEFTYLDGIETLEVIRTFVSKIDVENNTDIEQVQEIESSIKLIDNTIYDNTLEETLNSINFQYNFILDKTTIQNDYFIYFVSLIAGLFIAFVIIFSLFIIKNEN